MKKVLSAFIVFVSLLLITAVAIPWNNLAQWGIQYPVLSDNEMYIKAGIGGLVFLFGLIFLIVGMVEYRNNGSVSKASSNAAFYPLWMYSIAAASFGLILAMFNNSYYNPTDTSQYIVYGIGFYLLNLVGFGHMMSSGFRSNKNFARAMLYLFLLELAALSAGIAYFMILELGSHYDLNMNTYNYALVGAVTLGFYIIHLIIIAVKKNRANAESELEMEVEEIEQRASAQKKSSKKEKGKKGKEIEKVDDPRKSFIVGKEQAIISKGSSLDPTEILYEDVSIDPEFSKVSGQSHQVNSIDYYIEKPKMYKPLDPTFDMLVEYVREFPSVVTKIVDEKITFYVDRNPFLVLMNYGNYYRMGFKYDLEKGIRLIIKYPTISKNKSTKDDLWFKANNYGDLPKEVIYQIVKSSYENATK